MNFVKITAAAIILAIIMATYASCTDSNDILTQPDSIITTEVTTEETEPLRVEHGLPQIDWQGRTFNIMGCGHDTYQQFVNFEIAAETITGDIVNDAVYNRNSKIKERYNVDIEQVLVQTPQTELPKYVNTGEDFINASFHTLGTVGPLAAAGYFIDFYSLPYIDFDKPWWYPDVNESLSVAGKLYITSSQFNMMDKNRTYSMCFNKDMAAEFDLGNLYSIVRNGQWTIDRMIEMCKIVAADLDGDGMMGEFDRWGYAMDSKNAFYISVNAMDNNIITKSPEDIPVITMMNERMLNSIDRAIALCCDKNIALFCEDFQGKVDYDFWSVSTKVFRDRGNALFTVSFTHSLKSHSANAEFNYGVLPYPKYDEEQEKYRSAPDPVAAALFAVPKTNTDMEFPGFILELLSAESMYDIMPLYIEVSAKTKYTYDSESAEMLDICFNSLNFDLGIIYNWGNLGTLLRSTIPTDGVNNLASLYAAVEESSKIAMEKTVDDFLSHD